MADVGPEAGSNRRVVSYISVGKGLAYCVDCNVAFPIAPACPACGGENGWMVIGMSMKSYEEKGVITVDEGYFRRLQDLERLIAERYPHCGCGYLPLPNAMHAGDCEYALKIMADIKKSAEDAAVAQAMSPERNGDGER